MLTLPALFYNSFLKTYTAVSTLWADDWKVLLWETSTAQEEKTKKTKILIEGFPKETIQPDESTADKPHLHTENIQVRGRGWKADTMQEEENIKKYH